MASLSLVCRHNTSVPAGQYCPHHLTGGEDYMRISFDLRVCIDAYDVMLPHNIIVKDGYISGIWTVSIRDRFLSTASGLYSDA